MSEKPYYVTSNDCSSPEKLQDRSWIAVFLIVLALHGSLLWVTQLSEQAPLKPKKQKVLVQTIQLSGITPLNAPLMTEVEKIIKKEEPLRQEPKVEIMAPVTKPEPKPEPEPEPIPLAPEPELKPEPEVIPQKQVVKHTEPPPIPIKPTPAPKKEVEKKIEPKPKEEPKKTTPPSQKAAEVKKTAPKKESPPKPEVTKQKVLADNQKKKDEEKAKELELKKKQENNVKEAEKKRQAEIAKKEVDKKKKEEQAVKEAQKKKQEEIAAKEAEKRRLEEVAAAEEKKRQLEIAAKEMARKQALIAKAQENLAKNKETRDKSSSAASINLQQTTVPGMITSLQIDALPSDKEMAAKWSVKEVSYRDEVAQRLRGSLRLPDYGAVKIELTVNKAGKVEKLKIISSESAKNKDYIERIVPTLIFPAFGTRFSDLPHCTFSITLNNEN